MKLLLLVVFYFLMDSVITRSNDKIMGKKQMKNKIEKDMDALLFRCTGRSSRCWEREANELLAGQQILS